MNVNSCVPFVFKSLTMFAVLLFSGLKNFFKLWKWHNYVPMHEVIYCLTTVLCFIVVECIPYSKDIHTRSVNIKQERQTSETGTTSTHACSFIQYSLFNSVFVEVYWSHFAWWGNGNSIKELINVLLILRYEIWKDYNGNLWYSLTLYIIR